MPSRVTPPTSESATAPMGRSSVEVEPAQIRRDDICVHIFTASATLVGVCLTVIGLLSIVRRLRGVSGIADMLLGVDAIGFLTACVISYAALRTEQVVRRRRIERYADGAFLLALALMTVACTLVAFELV